MICDVYKIIGRSKDFRFSGERTTGRRIIDTAIIKGVMSESTTSASQSEENEDDDHRTDTIQVETVDAHYEHIVDGSPESLVSPENRIDVGEGSITRSVDLERDQGRDDPDEILLAVFNIDGQAAGNFVAIEQDDNLVFSEEEYLELDILWNEEMDTAARFREWIESKSELRDLVRMSLRLTVELIPKPSDDLIIQFREEFGTDLIGLLHGLRATRVASSSTAASFSNNNHQGVPLTAPPVSRRSKNRPDKYSCSICGQSKTTIIDSVSKTFRSHECRPTLDQVVAAIKRHFYDPVTTTTAAKRRKSPDRSDQGPSSYKCGRCGQPKKGHDCSYLTEYGRVAKRIKKSLPQSHHHYDYADDDGVADKIIRETIEKSKEFQFSPDDNRRILHPVNRPTRILPQAMEHMNELRRSRPGQVNVTMMIIFYDVPLVFSSLIDWYC